MLLIFLIGFLMGFLGSVPIAGPIAALVLRRGLQGRVWSGFYVGIGASVAEGLYAYLAFWGMGSLLSRYPWVEEASRALGAVLLVGLGILFIVRPPTASQEDTGEDEPVGMKRNLALGFTVTGLNPTLIATWSAAVTMGMSLLPVAFAPRHALPFALGAAAGIAIWFSTMLFLLHRFRDRFRPETTTFVARLTGGFLVLLGGSAAVRIALAMSSAQLS